MSDLAALHAEGAGLLQLCTVAAEDTPGLLLASLSGDKDSARIMRAVSQTIPRIESAPRKKPMLCGACPRAVRNGRYMLVVAIPACDDPTKVLTLAICDHCSRQDRERAEARAIEGLRRIWPDLKPVRISHPAGGHA